MRVIKRISSLISVPLFSLAVFSCNFFASFMEPDENKVGSVVFDKNSLELSVGSMDIINVTIQSDQGQNKETVSWSYDESIISATADNYSIVITGIKAGTTIIRASCGDKSAQCALSVLSNGESAKIENPYVYVSADYLSIAPGDTGKVYASVYGGTASDSSGFTFTSDKPGIASVYAEGNYCWITGKSEGLARITCRHPKSPYGYSFLVAVSASSLDVPYITTTSNIVTINKSTESSKSFAVDLKNPAYTTYKDDFTYSVVDAGGNIMTDPPVSLSASSNKVSVAPLKSGSCYVRVSHPSASYDFNVLVRVVENIDTAYIEPSSTYVVLNGGASETVELSIADLPDGVAVDNDKYEWEFSDNAGSYLDYSVYNGSGSGKGNTVWLTGKKNGTVKITVSHPLCKSTRSILVLVRNITSEASSSKVYITTSQNYIETKVGAGDTTVNISINNISSGADELEWEIMNEAADGSRAPVIMYTGGTGTAASKASRAAIPVTSGYAVITPLREGTATITVSHPKAAYSTKILVNVLAEDYVSVQPLVLSTATPFVSIKNGDTESVTVSLAGSAKEAGDDNSIVWACPDPNFTISADGATANITAGGTGLNKATLTVSHDKADYPLSIILAGYDEAADLEGLSTLYAAQSSYIIHTGDEINVFVTPVSNQAISPDEVPVSWSVANGLNEIIGFTEYGRSATVTGIGVGTAEITACLTGNPSEKVTFHITVKQSGIIQEDKPCYLTTDHNVVTTSVGNTENISVIPVNIDGLKYTEIIWTNNNPELFSLRSNGANATITALAEGNGTVEISHPLSSNSLTLTVHVGTEYVYSNTDVRYIASDDIVTLTTGSEETMLYAVLCHTENSLTETKGFTFRSSDTSVFTVSYSSDKNYCYIKPREAGQGILTIHHSDADYDKDVLVIIQRSAAELADIPYISTSQNVATVIQGEYTTLTVMLRNAENYEASAWTWSSSDSGISDVVVNSGTTAMISGVNPGTTKITVSHADCLYPLEIIVICLDSNKVSSSPFIHTSSNIITLPKGGAETVTADMVGGSATDDTSFIWTIADSTVALISSGSGSCYVKGLKAGQTYITVRNRNYPDAYSKTVFVRVEDTTDAECYITVTSKVLRMNPADSDGETITATLENGGVLDAQDFVWWADDYNIVSLSSVTDTARIVPTGVSGTTYVHVKHPKVVTTLDILIMCSEYKEFAFKYLSKDILEKSIVFIPMEVPVTSEESWIEYESSDNNVVVATGSNQVCMLAGIVRGSATVTARLRTANGTVGTAQIAVIVEKAAASINTISMNSTIINMEIGESRTLEALLSGASITSNDYYNLEWVLTSNENSCINLLQNEAGKTTGKNSYITARSGGTAVLTLSHPACIYDLTVWIIVPEKEETDISLTQTYVEMYKSDGSATVTARLINGSSSDYGTITWTAPKVGGVNIISISKTSGPTCNIVPRNVGSTTLRAQLPNGNHADCVVTVLTDAEIVLETKTVHVNPGFTETVNYTVTPENATINWIEMMNGTSSFGTVNNFFDFSVNESTKVITVTGKELGSGIIYGYSANDSGTAKAQLSVICEYRYELDFDGDSGIITMHPDDSGLVTTRNSPHNLADIPFHVYPKSGMEIDITSSDPAIEISSYSFDPSKGTGVIHVKALTEEIGGYITLSATNPNDKENTPLSRKKFINSKYDHYTINPVFDFDARAGSFSHYEPNNSGGRGTLYLGDGENYRFYLDIAEPNAKLNNITVTYKPQSANDPDTEVGDESCTDASEPHIYFSGEKKSGVLKPEMTDSKGVQYYKIGHNYDYKTNGYLTSGDCRRLFTVSPFTESSSGVRNIKYTYNPFNWSNHWNHQQTNYIVTSAGEKTTTSNDITELLYSGVDEDSSDGEFYYYEESDFKGFPYWFTAERYDCDHKAPKWNANIHSNDDRCEANHVYRYEVNGSFLPTYVGPTACRNDSYTLSSRASLVISYKDLNGVQSSGEEERYIDIYVERRNCPNNIKGQWKRTSDSNGRTCWKFMGNKGDMAPYITSKTVSVSSDSSRSIKLNTNCDLTAANTGIKITSSVNSSDAAPAQIKAELGSDNTLIVTTGPKSQYTVIYEDENGETQEEIALCDTVTVIALTYSQGGRTCAGEITVIH